MSKKILNFFDKYLLKIGLGFLLIFIPLYPKLPLFDIKHTWVYIRFEDLLVLAIALIWIIQLLRKKVDIRNSLTLPIICYWFIGGVSLLFSLIFLKNQLANFFPTVAALHYLRRIEYILPFFIAVSTIKSLRDVKHYLIIISLTCLGVVLYGFGQRYVGFPAFLTMNEEFAKGTPFYLSPTSRVTSTFAGHYDLAAFLVIMIVFLGSFIFGIKKKIFKLALFILVFFAFILLLFTASRISFGVYIIAVSFMLYLHNKKWLIVPVVLASIFLMFYISGASERFAKTIRVEKVVYNTKTGKPIAVLEEPKLVTPDEPPVPEDSLPLGSGFLPVPILDKQPEATTVAVIKRSILASLKTAQKDSEIATISGNFLIKRTIVYDISFTTRFQGEWPRAWKAFQKNPLLGSGYSSISLATDNDYLRALGETGLLGFLSLLTIFSIAALVLRRALKRINSPFEKSFLVGMGAGFSGFLLNASLIDIFEASKVAFPFWMILGITVGMVRLKKVSEKSLWNEAIEVIKLPSVAIVVFLFAIGFLFTAVMNNYFVGDDFTWLKWATVSVKENIPSFFLWADGYFYQPLGKTYFTLIQPFLGLRPQGYHFVDLLFHFGSTVAVYFIGFSLIKKKLIAFLGGLFFLIHPINAESIFWISSTSANMAVFFYLWSFLFYSWWRCCVRRLSQILLPASLLAFTLGIFSHELALTFPLMIFLFDLLFVKKPKKWFSRLLPLMPYFLILDIYLWLRVGAGAHGLSGDYGYNLKNLLFNIIGNLWGYLGILLVGEKFIPLYDFMRFFSRSHKIWIVSGVLLSSIIIVLFLRTRFKFKKWSVDGDSKILIFTLGWFVVALLPFLGLGNMAERYVYLASFAFSLALAIFISFVWERIKRKNILLAIGVLIILISLIGGLCWRGVNRTERNWRIAGETTNKILLSISSNYADFSQGTTLYFVNLPMRRERAWIFPVGLKDGLWFIYRNEDLKIEQINDVEEALDLAEKNTPSHVFVFEDGELKEAKRE